MTRRQIWRSSPAQAQPAGSRGQAEHALEANADGKSGKPNSLALHSSGRPPFVPPARPAPLILLPTRPRRSARRIVPLRARRRRRRKMHSPVCRRPPCTRDAHGLARPRARPRAWCGCKRCLRSPWGLLRPCASRAALCASWLATAGWATSSRARARGLCGACLSALGDNKCAVGSLCPCGCRLPRVRGGGAAGMEGGGGLPDLVWTCSIISVSLTF